MTKDNGAVRVPAMPEALEELRQAPAFTGSERLATAGRIVMTQHVAKLHKHLPGVLSGDDPHDVHQMRVATRRLRACLQSTAIAYDHKTVTELRKRLRRLARALGEVRDRDVLLLRLRADAEALDEAARDPLHDTIARVEEQRAEAHTDLLDELRRKRTQRLLADLHKFLLATDGQNRGDELPLLVRHHAGSAIWHEYEAVLHFETLMPDASAEQLHELRIACKHLRYTLELFAPALGDDAKALIKQVTAMQEHLGNLHDADVAIDYFADTHPPIKNAVEDSVAENGAVEDGAASDDGLPATTLARYIAQRAAERDALHRDVAALWRQLTSDTTRRKLGKAIAGL
jgi:CHAD domain-containing protein